MDETHADLLTRKKSHANSTVRLVSFKIRIIRSRKTFEIIQFGNKIQLELQFGRISCVSPIKIKIRIRMTETSNKRNEGKYYETKSIGNSNKRFSQNWFSQNGRCLSHLLDSIERTI